MNDGMIRGSWSATEMSAQRVLDGFDVGDMSEDSVWADMPRQFVRAVVLWLDDEARRLLGEGERELSQEMMALMTPQGVAAILGVLDLSVVHRIIERVERVMIRDAWKIIELHVDGDEQVFDSIAARAGLGLSMTREERANIIVVQTSKPVQDLMSRYGVTVVEGAGV